LDYTGSLLKYDRFHIGTGISLMAKLSVQGEGVRQIQCCESSDR
jgi:hypothetical protein